jgi:NAD(P)H-flavin reductase
MEYRTEFLERIERTPTAVSYRFAMPPGFTFTAGQWMAVDPGDGLVHPLSVSSCPEESDYIEFTKRMTGSQYCDRLRSLNKGEIISVKGPFGEFGIPESGKTCVMIAGGIGITPIRSILKSLEKKTKDIGTIILIYSNMNEKEIAFRDELEYIKLSGYRLVHVLSDTTGVENAYQGFVTADIISEEVTDISDAYYMISGPPAMVKAMVDALAGIDVAESRISTDVFLGYN